MKGSKPGVGSMRPREGWERVSFSIREGEGVTDFGRKVWRIGAFDFFSIRDFFFFFDGLFGKLEGRRGEESKLKSEGN